MRKALGHVNGGVWGQANSLSDRSRLFSFVRPVLSKKAIAQKMEERREEGLQQKIGEVRKFPLQYYESIVSELSRG